MSPFTWAAVCSPGLDAVDARAPDSAPNDDFVICDRLDEESDFANVKTGVILPTCK